MSKPASGASWVDSMLERMSPVGVGWSIDRRKVICHAPAPCAPGYDLPVPITPDDLGPKGLETKVVVRTRRCAICGNDHDFKVTLSDEDRDLLGRASELDSPQPSESNRPIKAPIDRLSVSVPRSDFFNSVNSAPAEILDHSQSHVSRAVKLYNQGLRSEDRDQAIEALREALDLYLKLPHHEAAAAQTRLALAERLSETDAEESRRLLDAARPQLLGSALHRARKRAEVLADKLSQLAS